jgi:predicted CXXCH cytochrome family protein
MGRSVRSKQGNGWRAAIRAAVRGLCAGLAGLVALAALTGQPASAFHSGGVAACGGCHTMHDPQQAFNPTNYLLKGANATDICLNCHGTSNGNSWGQSPTMPGRMSGGGPFIFLTEDNLNDGPGGAVPANWIRGDAAGHNLVSIDFGLAADPLHANAPGGSYPSAAMGCTSCHDPHGKFGHFRLLYGRDSNASRANNHVFQFTTDAPDATGIDLDGTPEAPTNHTAFRGGMSAWCGNCHGRYHDETSGSAFQHPIDAVLEPAMIQTYNEYRGTGFRDGVASESYEPLVPYEAAGMTTASTGPTPSTAKVTCLSCHRAHASSGPASGRWDFKIELWSQEGIASGSYRIPNPYDTTAGGRQKPLCAKCHGD